MKIEPISTQSIAGSQPNITLAKIGPFIGPAAAMAEKCCPRSILFFAGT